MWLPRLDIGAVEEVGQGFFVFGGGGSLFFCGGEGVRGGWGAEALAGVGFDGLGYGEDLFLGL